MKIFHCDHCHHCVYFENVQCVNCRHALGYLLDLHVIGSLDSVGNRLWSSPLPRAAGKSYRMCQNYSQENVCNWMVPADDPNHYCLSCRLTHVIPDLSKPGNREAWYELEAAKRRLLYGLISLGLTVTDRTEAPDTGLLFKFLADFNGSVPSVLTGHDNGVITINIAEADHAEREKRRVQMHEPYRTVLGHFRHEIGHYYWDRLIKDSDRIEPFRELFGAERDDYAKALERHYQKGAPPDWQENFVSIYATTHPWEDWAETWAHFLHISDTLETAMACGLSLLPNRSDEPALRFDTASNASPPVSFDHMIQRWFPLTFVLNNLNRGMGLQDGYPFVLSKRAIQKLRFVYDAITSQNTSMQACA